MTGDGVGGGSETMGDEGQAGAGTEQGGTLASTTTAPIGGPRVRHREVAEEKVRRVELIISLVLRIGVVVSVLVIAIGLGIFFDHHAGYASFSGSASYKPLVSTSFHFPDTFGGLGHSLAKGEGRGVIVLGLLLLILTPVMRVAVSILTFVYEKDPPMVIVTSFVLIALVGSFFLGRAGG
jgi:uncharacterized membrane protein